MLLKQDDNVIANALEQIARARIALTESPNDMELLTKLETTARDLANLLLVQGLVDQPLSQRVFEELQQVCFFCFLVIL